MLLDVQPFLSYPRLRSLQTLSSMWRKIASRFLMIRGKTLGCRRTIENRSSIDSDWPAENSHVTRMTSFTVDPQNYGDNF